MRDAALASRDHLVDVTVAAGNCAHRYIGKVCCLLLVQADYIRPRPRARPRGHGELLKLLRVVMVVLARGPGCPSRHEPARSQGFGIPADNFRNELARV